jgi:hypothetical protein
MFNPNLRKLYYKFLVLAILVGCLGFLSSGYVPVARASSCDVDFSENVYGCSDNVFHTNDSCSTYPGQYECCYNAYVDTYNLCVLQNGPIGATPLQPVEQPAPDPDAEQPSFIELKVKSCRMSGAHNTRYNTCMANGGTDDFCCMYAWTF